MISKNLIYIILICSFSNLVCAKPTQTPTIRVLATTTDLKVIVEEVGEKNVKVDAFCKGTQDPHFLEAKPSYILNTSQADLVVSIGLGLEIGWLPKVLAGGRNPKVMEGSIGYLEVGPTVKVLEIPTGSISRAEGDVHPEGNPHVTLDPVRVGEIAIVVAKRLGEIKPALAKDFLKRAKSMQTRLKEKTKNWSLRINKSGFKKLVTHHKSLSYFFDRFGIESVAMLEPLPGVPPTASHILEVMKSAKQKGVKKILVEHYFSNAAAKKVASQVPNIFVKSVPVAVSSSPQVKTIDDLFETVVRQIEAKS